MDSLDGLFMDELLNEPYEDPVMAEDGFVYERSFITEWFMHGGTKSPKTLLPIGTALYYPFAYFQMRAAWLAAKGLPVRPFPERYGRLPPVTVPQAAHRRSETVTIRYDDGSEAEDMGRPSGYEDEYPPLPRAAVPEHPSPVLGVPFNRRVRPARRR